ncbi:MAG: hypothetical protein ACI4TK_09165 [Agathobacter sp.]
MRKALAILMLLVLLSGLGIYRVNASIGGEADQVQFRENVIYGDKSVVEGVTIERNVKYNRNLYWNTRYTVGKTPAIDTDFTYYPFGKGEEWKNLNSALYFYSFDGNVLNETETDENIDSVDRKGLSKAFFELIKEAPAGTTTTKQIYLKDYAEYYGVDGIEFNLSNFNYFIHRSSSRQEKEKQILDAFEVFFRIPVLEDEQYIIGVHKDEKGKVTGYGYVSNTGGMSVDDMEISSLPTDTRGDSFSLGVMNVVCTEDTCYFTFYPFTEEGKIVDTSLIPGGYGIYSFQYDAEKETIDTSSLKLAYSLEPTGYVSLELDTDGNLLIFTEDDTQFYLTVVDLATMQQKQQLAYGYIPDEKNLARAYWVMEDFLIAQYSYEEAMIFSKNEAGTYQKEYTIPAEVTEVSTTAYFLTGGDCCYDWDGKRLLVAGSLRGDEAYWQELCGVYLAVFDETGLIYYGEYYSTLDSSEGDKCEPTYSNRLNIAWK